MYLLDANVFIQAKNLHYGFDFCPAFWEWLAQQHQAQAVFSVEKVFGELKAGADPLAEWAEARQDFFLKPDEAVVPSLQIVSNWAANAGYEPAAVNTFLQVGDYYLVAHAHAHDFTVVTHEIPANSTKKIKIPNACIELGVKCITPYEMLRTERARFVLGPSP
jgi:predicted nucleic acid-binding protein